MARLSPPPVEVYRGARENRAMFDRNAGKGLFALDPPDSEDNLFSGFVQDQISLLDNLKLTLGTKLEHNDFSGFEAQPTGRVAWSAPGGHESSAGQIASHVFQW